MRTCANLESLGDNNKNLVSKQTYEVEAQTTRAWSQGRANTVYLKTRARRCTRLQPPVQRSPLHSLDLPLKWCSYVATQHTPVTLRSMLPWLPGQFIHVHVQVTSRSHVVKLHASIVEQWTIELKESAVRMYITWFHLHDMCSVEMSQTPRTYRYVIRIRIIYITGKETAFKFNILKFLVTPSIYA